MRDTTASAVEPFDTLVRVCERLHDRRSLTGGTVAEPAGQVMTPAGCPRARPTRVDVPLQGLRHPATLPGARSAAGSGGSAARARASRTDGGRLAPCDGERRPVAAAPASAVRKG